jgi:hypothetical protein
VPIRLYSAIEDRPVRCAAFWEADGAPAFAGAGSSSAAIRAVAAAAPASPDKSRVVAVDEGAATKEQEGQAFSKIKAWLVGTHHGVSAEHLVRYLREWSYRFNRRNLPDGLDGYLIRCAVECTTIT